jgi:hypothetical protein
MASVSVKKYIRVKNSQTVEPGMLKQPQPGLPARFLALPRQN